MPIRNPDLFTTISKENAAKFNAAIENSPRLQNSLGLFNSIKRLLLSFSLSLGRFNFFYLMEAKVVSINATSAAAEAAVVYFFKTNDNWILDTALIDGRNRTNFVVPVRLWTENSNFRTALNHKSYPLMMLQTGQLLSAYYGCGVI